MNLFSAFSAALTVALVYLILRKLGARRIPSIFGSLVLALTPLFWKQASIAEVYATSAVCLAFLLFTVLQWRETGDSRWLFLAGFLGGLSLGIHTAVALSAPAVLLYMIFRRPEANRLGPCCAGGIDRRSDVFYGFHLS